MPTDIVLKDGVADLYVIGACSRVIRGGLGIPWKTWALPGTHEAKMSKSAPRYRIGIIVVGAVLMIDLV